MSTSTTGDNPSLDQLMQKEAEAAEELSRSFIRFSLARNDVLNALRKVRENLPGIFTDEFDFNQLANSTMPLPPEGDRT